jgi:hypothetical protein
VVRCLEKNRERRFQTVAALAAALVPLAPGDARAYASRSSGILRASTLNLGVASGASSERKERRPQRFQSSALVAAATILALSVLGVTITVAKMRGLGVQEITASALNPAPVAAPSIPAALRASSEPSAPVTLHAGEPPSVPAVPPSSAPPAPIARNLPSSVGPSTLALPGADAAVAPKLNPRRLLPGAAAGGGVAADRRAVRTSVGATLPATTSAGRASRVRLVDDRPKLRLVDDLEVERRGAANGSSIIRRVDDASEGSRP